MGNSFYTENTNLTPYHIDWMDGCGAKWKSGETFGGVTIPREVETIQFRKENGSDNYQFFYFYSPGTTHCTTGDQFCSEIAKILGTTFEPEQSGNSEQLNDEQDKLFPGRNNTMGEGSLTQEDIETLLGDSIANQIKGMAIEVSRLSEEDKEHIKTIYRFWNERYTFCVCSKLEGEEFSYINLCERISLENKGYTITDSPKVFMEYVASQTGKEYKPDALAIAIQNQKENVDKLLGKSVIAKITDIKFHLKEHPHKTYRILDSLDNWPLDKRTKLSETTPTPRKKVLLIFEDKFFEGWIQYVDEFGFRIGSDSKDYFSVLDGEWMRIV